MPTLNWVAGEISYGGALARVCARADHRAQGCVRPSLFNCLIRIPSSRREFFDSLHQYDVMRPRQSCKQFGRKGRRVQLGKRCLPN